LSKSRKVLKKAEKSIGKPLRKLDGGWLEDDGSGFNVKGEEFI